MRMLKPSPGECADRQTILKLKLDHADTQAPDEEFELNVEEVVGKTGRVINKGASEIDLQPFIWENNALQDYLEKEWFPDFPHIADSYDLLFDQLSEVNGKLWKLEDEARTLRSTTKNNATVYRAATVLFEITQANDERSELVQKINALFNVTAKEKIYAA